MVQTAAHEAFRHITKSLGGSAVLQGTPCHPSLLVWSRRRAYTAHPPSVVVDHLPRDEEGSWRGGVAVTRQDPCAHGGGRTTADGEGTSSLLFALVRTPGGCDVGDHLAN